MSPKVGYMTDPRTVIAHISMVFPQAKEMFDDVPHRELCSALAYRYILKNHGVTKNIQEILADEPFIGLLGPHDEFEAFHKVRFLRLHAVLHDAYGRVFTKYGLDRGYLYCFDGPICLRGYPLLGHITGFWFCLRHKLLG